MPISRHFVKSTLNQYRAKFHEQISQQHGCQKKGGEFQKEQIQQEGTQKFSIQ